MFLRIFLSIETRVVLFICSILFSNFIIIIIIILGCAKLFFEKYYFFFSSLRFRFRSLRNIIYIIYIIYVYMCICVYCICVYCICVYVYILLIWSRILTTYNPNSELTRRKNGQKKGIPVL